MIWEKNIASVVMLTKLTEKGTVRHLLNTNTLVTHNLYSYNIQVQGNVVNNKLIFSSFSTSLDESCQHM